MPAERPLFHQPFTEEDRQYPNFEQELHQWLARWPQATQVRESKIQLKRKRAATDEPRPVDTADILAFLHKWYPTPTSPNQLDQARDAYKNARDRLGIKGEKRPQTTKHFYTVAEAVRILRSIYRESSLIRAVERKK